MAQAAVLKSMRRHGSIVVSAAVLTAVLAACEAPPKPVAGVRPPTVPRDAEPAPAPPPVVAPPVVVSAESRVQAQRVSIASAELLEAGNEELARTDLKRALTLDPQNKLALSLVRQMTVDPIATLGRESFAYTVRQGDSMSRIAGRFMNDVYSFYLLARYNDIKVPRLVSAGQVIRVPGRAPPPGAVSVSPPPSPPAPTQESSRANLPASPAPTPSPAPSPSPPPPPPPPPPPSPEPTVGEVAMRNGLAAEKAADLPRARAEYLKADRLNQPGAAAKAEQIRALLVNRYSVAARTALTRQDLDGAIAAWQRVLDNDADNATARLEIDRVRKLKEKLGSVK